MICMIPPYAGEVRRGSLYPRREVYEGLGYSVSGCSFSLCRVEILQGFQDFYFSKGLLEASIQSGFRV